MALTLLASGNGANKQTITSAIAQRENRTFVIPENNPRTDDQDSENNGGFLGGVAYLGEKVALNALSGIEGIWDYTAGGVAKLFGADSWAERQFANDWVNYNHADEWYDPDKGWSFAGDIAGGIGSSLPSIVITGVAVAASGGALLPAAGAISGSIAGLGAAGNATKEAYRKTGKLGGKEFAYGALVGATEGLMETATAKIGVGTGRIVSSIAKKSAGDVTKTLAKSGAKNVLKALGQDFVSEAFEEGVAEILSPVYQRMTYDPDAKNASAQEVAYAALIGGLSGALMSGANTTVNTSRNLISGNKVVSEGKTATVLENARQITERETAHETGYESFKAVSNTYQQLSESLKSTNGEVATVKQKMLLGQLTRENTVATFSPFIERSAENIVRNVDTIVERYNALGMKDANGNPITFTKEQILSGIDLSADRKTYVKQLRKALSSNSTLATLAVADAMGNITMDTRRFAELALEGKNLATLADYENFRQNATAEEKAAVGAALGIENFDLVKVEDFRAAVEQFAADGKMEAWAKQSRRVQTAVETAADTAKPMPNVLRKNMTDGVYRYTSEDSTVNMAVFKEGSEYHIYDYDSGKISRSLTSQEVNKVLRDVRQGVVSQTSEAMENANQNAEKRLALPTEKRYNKSTQHIKIPKQEYAVINSRIMSDNAKYMADNKKLPRVNYVRSANYFYVYENFSAGEFGVIKRVALIEQNREYIRTLESFIKEVNENGTDEVTGSDGQVLALFGLNEGGNHRHYAVDTGGRATSGDVHVFSTKRKSDNGSNSGESSGTERTQRLSEANADLDGYARENIKDYDKLSAPNQAEIRAMIREGRALGMPDGDVLLYAKISARTGVRVTFDKGKTLIGRRKGTRELVYADGFYDPATNEICVNPDGERSAEKLLIHELAHAIYGNAKGMRLAIRNTRNLSMEEREEISRRYAEVGRTNKIELLDEYNAHYAEGILGNAATLERLLDDAPTVKDRILDFLRGAKGDTDAQRSAAARRLFYRYKRLFDRFAQQNAQNIAAERLPTVATDTEKKTPHGEAPEANGVTNTQELSVKRKDAAYLDAVSRGDVEAAQRMVDEAADKAGYTVDAYHGTDADFTVFDKNSVGKGADEYGAGFYFAKQRAYSSEFGKNVYKVRLKIENPIKLHRTPGGGGTLYDVKITPEQAYKILKKHPMMFDKTDSPLAGRFDEYRKVGAKKWMVRELATSYKSLGVLCDKYFGIFKDYPNEFHEAVRDVLGYDGVEVYNDPEVRSLESGDYFYVAWFDDQMKSADPIVRDDNGNVIPLSERFNEKKNDIRYAMPEDIQKKTPHGEAPEANGVTRINDEKMQVSGKRYAIERISETIDKALANKGDIGEKFNQKKISEVPRNIATVVSAASEGKIDLSEKFVSVNGSDIWHEYRRHNDMRIEIDRDQIAFTPETIKEAVAAIYDPDIVESVFADVNNPTQRQSFAYAKKSPDGHYVVVEAVGGKRNPNVVPVMIIQVSERKWNRWIENGKTLGDMLYENDQEKLAALNIAFNKKNRVTVAQFASNEAIANTPRSPQFNNSIPDSEKKVNRNLENSTKKRLALSEDTKIDDGFVGSYTGTKYTSTQAKLLADVSTEGIQNATDLAGRQDIGFNHLGISNRQTRREWIDAGLAYIDKNADGEDVIIVHEAILMDERERRQKLAQKSKTNANENADVMAEFSKELKDQLNEETDRESEIDLARARAEDAAAKEISRVKKREAKRAEYWKEKAKENESRSKVLGNISNLAGKMKDLKLGTYHNATQDQSKQFAGSVEGLSKIVWNGNLSVKLARKHIGTLRAWYKQDNPILCYQDKENPGYYNAEIAEMLTGIADGEGGFSVADLRTIRDIMQYFLRLDETYNKVFKNGKWVDAEAEAKRYIGTINANKELKVGFLAQRGCQIYMETFSEPLTVARRMDYYAKGGFYTETLLSLREAAVNADVAEMEIKADYDDFMQRNKKYLAKTTEETVTYRGTAIPRMQLIGLYMTFKRKQAQAGLVINGFSFHDKNGETVRVPGTHPEFGQKKDLTQKDITGAAEAEIVSIEKLLTDTDKEYIEILEKAFNEDARKLKADTDMQRLGYTNAHLDYYYPIRRGDIAKNIDTSTYFDEMDRVSNASYNKDTVRGARQKLFIESADSVFNRHVHSVCLYANLSPVIDTYNRLYNLDVSGNSGDPNSVKTASENVWKNGSRYIAKLVADIQGIPASSAEGQKLLGFIRSGYAQYQLGANPKTWASQISSIFASSSLLDADAITRGIGISSEGIDEYCPLAKLRNNDNTVAKTQGLLERVNKVSEVLMAPIGKVDRFVICRLFGACQVQVEKNGGAKVGTEENKIAAGKLLREVILETQQNSAATEKSAAMRSGSEILRTVTMFSADSMKVLGRVIDSVGEVSVLKVKLKQKGLDAKTRTALENDLKAAHRKARKSVGALMLSALYMVGIAQFFKFLYAKEDDEENKAASLVTDFVGNLFGGLPVLRDVVSFFTEGYEVDNYAYSALNDLLSSSKSLFDAFGDIVSGDASSQDIAAGTKRMLYSVGQLFGIPVRNVYNVTYGLTKRFSPETAYKIDMVFYKKNFQNDLKKAVENGDEDMVNLIMGILYGERISEAVPEAVHGELYALSLAGHKVIPRSIPSTITYNDEERALTDEEREAIKEVYSASLSSLEKLFTKPTYEKLTEEQKVEAINYVYDTYYKTALKGTLGVDRLSNVQRAADVIGAETLALLHIATKGLESDADRDGNTISGSKRKKVLAAINSLGLPAEKKLLLICMKGYSIKDGDIRGMSAERAKRYLLRYILSMRGKSQAEKAELAELCGFTVRNGRIIIKTAS